MAPNMLKQYIPVTAEEQTALRNAARENGIGVGLLCRALTLRAFKSLSASELEQLIQDEKDASNERLSAGAKEARRHRWDSKDDKEPDDV